MGNLHNVRLEPVGIEFEVDEDETVLEGAFRQGLMLMHGCKEGQCSACKSFLLDGEVDMDRYSTFALPDYEQEEGWTLLCRAHAVSGAFPGETDDHDLDALRQLFQRKALVARQARLCQALLVAGRTPEEVTARSASPTSTTRTSCGAASSCVGAWGSKASRVPPRSSGPTGRRSQRRSFRGGCGWRASFGSASRSTVGSAAPCWTAAMPFRVARRLEAVNDAMADLDNGRLRGRGILLPAGAA
jgi:ferredoxin